jgi:hypothetical protein
VVSAIADVDSKTKNRIRNADLLPIDLISMVLFKNVFENVVRVVAWGHTGGLKSLLVCCAD